MTEKLFVHVAIGTLDYRFFGPGEWKKRYRSEWRDIDPADVPDVVTRLAATQCHPDSVPADIEYVMGKKP